VYAFIKIKEQSDEYIFLFCAGQSTTVIEISRKHVQTIEMMTKVEKAYKCMIQGDF
jgi:hypothetical protein